MLSDQDLDEFMDLLFGAALHGDMRSHVFVLKKTLIGELREANEAGTLDKEFRELHGWLFTHGYCSEAHL